LDPRIPYNSSMGFSSIARPLLLGILLLGLTGAAAELFLLGHYEDWKQWMPLVLLVGALASFAVYGITRSRHVLRALRWLAVAFIVAGFTGLYLHYSGNAEFEREMVPSIGGAKLVWEALTGATPALAPGTMVQLGLLIWLYLYKHPALVSEENR